MIRIKATKIIETIKGETEEDFPLFVADHPKEIILRDFAEYEQYLEQCSEVGHDKEVEDIAQYYKEVTVLLSFFTYKDESLSERVSFQELIQLGIDQESGSSLEAVFVQVHKNINSYQPTVRQQFTHKGKIFFCPKSTIDALGKKRWGSKLTVLEAVQALQLEHVFNQKLQDGTKLVDRKFRTQLGLLATFCRPVGKDGKIKTIPFDTTKRDRLLNQRMAFFEDVTLDIALDVAFFLRTLSDPSRLARQRQYYMNHLPKISKKQGRKKNR